MIRTTLITLSASLMALTLPAMAQTYAITGGDVWTGLSETAIENGTVLIENGTITAVGDSALAIPDGAEVIDASGKVVTPGIFSPFSRTGLVEVNAVRSTNDISADNSAYSVALNAADAFNPSATSIDVTRIEGVTRLAVAPGFGANIFAGQGFIANTSGAPHSISEERVFQFIALGETGATLSGGSRTANWTYLKAALMDADRFPSGFMVNEGNALSRIDAEALIPVLRGEQLLLIHAHRASDLLRIVQFSADNPRLDIAIIGAREGWQVADQLAGAGIPVIIDPFDNLPAGFDSLAATSRNAQRLIEAGVQTAFAHLGDSTHQARLILQSAGNAVANGVSKANALKAVTSVPADIFGFDSLGRLERGAQADVVIWDGDPLEVTSAPVILMIDGALQSLTSRQTKLRKRYLNLTKSETDLPFAYDK